MEVAFSILVGIFFAVAIYLMLSRHIIRMLLGIAILGNGGEPPDLHRRSPDARGAADHRSRDSKHRTSPSPTLCRRR